MEIILYKDIEQLQISRGKGKLETEWKKRRSIPQESLADLWVCRHEPSGFMIRRHC